MGLGGVEDPGEEETEDHQSRIGPDEDHPCPGHPGWSRVESHEGHHGAYRRRDERQAEEDRGDDQVDQNSLPAGSWRRGRLCVVHVASSYLMAASTLLLLPPIPPGHTRIG